ncbi:MAG: FAD-dependent oxidoreductase [Eubacteriales bacterium]
MNSIWTNNAERPHFDAQQKDLQTDVLIIGGGLAGILCAYFLDAAGVDYRLVEADRICSGITQNTTAKITFQHGLIYDRLIRQLGMADARMYLDANRSALTQYHKLCQTVDCDYEQKDAFVYSLTNRRKIQAEVEAYHKLGIPAESVTDLPLPFSVAGAVRVAGQGQFHPLKFAYGIATGLRIMEHTKVTELMPGAVRTNHGTIQAKKIIVATHFPFLNKHGSYYIKLFQHRSYVIALQNAPDVKGIYLDESKTGLSFRNCGDLLLLGGGSHRTGKRGGNWQELADFASRHYRGAKEVARWATQDCMSLDGMPYIGQYSKRTPDLYVATGFNKWGITSSMVAAMILSDLIQGKENRYALLFSPSRSILHPQLAINAAESMIGLLTPTVPRCPHLGCALKYNRQEHSWDCPCHGSRFSESGALIDNPSTDDRKK